MFYINAGLYDMMLWKVKHLDVYSFNNINKTDPNDAKTYSLEFLHAKL